MRVREARDVARQWITQEASKLPGLMGAFTAGSTNWLPDQAILPPGTDVDIMVVLDLAAREETAPPTKLGKFAYRDVLLEVTYLDLNQLQPVDRVLGDYHLAASLYTAHLIHDPLGRVSRLQAAMAENYNRRDWVQTRCQQAYNKIRRQLAVLESQAHFPEQVIGWLFPTGVMAHVLLVAGLKNPTVRLRYRAVRELLARYGLLDYYPTLLTFLGCADMSRAQVEQHLAPLTRVFDATSPIIQSPYSYASDLSAAARPIAIDGTRTLIQRGAHREAVFWMVATYSRCQIVLRHDAPPAMLQQFDPGYHALLAELGIHGLADLQARSQQILAHLPTLWTVAEAILAANPTVQE